MITQLLESREFQDFLKALASETRQKILLQFMSGREMTVNEVAQATGLGQSTASEHLSMLKRGGLLKANRKGKEVYYRPDRTQTLELLRQLNEVLSGCCPPES